MPYADAFDDNQGEMYGRKYKLVRVRVKYKRQKSPDSKGYVCTHMNMHRHRYTRLLYVVNLCRMIPGQPNQTKLNFGTKYCPTFI